MEELLSLKWNNHRSTFIHIIAGLREKQSYTDVTLACDGKFYSVHKLVLSTCSEYFSAMFDKTPCKNPVIVLKDIKSDDLDALLDYMYLGEVNVRQSDLASLIKAAECLRIKGLAVPDDEPPKKMGPGRAGSSNAPERRTDSPPAKRKRREGSEESREDSRHSSQQPHPAQAQTPPPSSSRPKTPPGGTQRHSPAPHPPRPSQSSPSEGGRAPSPTHPPVVSPAERTTPQSRGGGEGEGFDQSAPFVKVEMDDGGQGDPLGDSYDVPSDGYKEESEVGGDLSNDFPEFLQAAAAGTLPGNASSFTHNYPGTSGFHHDLSGWQGEQPLGGSFSGLNFPHTSQDSSQNAQPGAGASPGLPCPACGRMFRGRNRHQNLSTHMRIHTGETPFPCPCCPYRAKRKAHLKLHLLRIHGQPPPEDSGAQQQQQQQLHMVGALGTSSASSLTHQQQQQHLPQHPFPASSLAAEVSSASIASWSQLLAAASSTRQEDVVPAVTDNLAVSHTSPSASPPPNPPAPHPLPLPPPVPFDGPDKAAEDSAPPQ